MERETEIDDLPDPTSSTLTLLKKQEPLTHIQIVIEAVKALGPKKQKMINSYALKYLNRLIHLDIDDKLMEEILELMHLLGFRDGDIVLRDKFSRLAAIHIQDYRIEFRTKDDAWRFCNKCEIVDVRNDPLIQKIAKGLIMKFANNEELTKKLSELFGLSDIERENLITQGREIFNALMRLRGFNI